MPCSYAGGSRDDPDRGLDRREFMKSALAIGGAGALTSAAGLSGEAAAEVDDPIGVAERFNRQHTVAPFLPPDRRGFLAPPEHRLLLLLDYQKEGEPTAEDRREMEGALAQLERAFPWAVDGLFFSVSYSPTYFDRFDEDLPEGVDLRRNQAVIDEIQVGDEDPTPDDYDVHVHMLNNSVPNLLAAEEALWGFPGQDRTSVNGVEFEHTFEGLFEKPTEFPDRRTGFVGPGHPSSEIDEDRIPEDAPLSMGFVSLFADNFPLTTPSSMRHDQTKHGEAMPPGIFAQGTIQHLSELSIDLDSWYDQSKAERNTRMMSPSHADLEGVGFSLGFFSGTDEIAMRDQSADEDIARRAQQVAEEQGVVGHQQKIARDRFDLHSRHEGSTGDGKLEQKIQRRDFNTTDRGGPGLHFISLQRYNSDLIDARRAMNGVKFASEEGSIDHDDVDLDPKDDGFLGFIETLRRGNYLLPPITLRALPPARGLAADVTVRSDVDTDDDGVVPVAVTGLDGAAVGDVDPSTLRFGPPGDVNRGAGARPAHDGHLTDDGQLVVHFPIADTGLEPGDDTARLRGKTGDVEPLLGDADVTVV